MSQQTKSTKASISKPINVPMDTDLSCFNERPRPAPLPTDSIRDSRSSYDCKRQPSYSSREHRPSTAALRSSVDSGITAVSTGSTLLSRSHSGASSINRNRSSSNAQVCTSDASEFKASTKRPSLIKRLRSSVSRTSLNPVADEPSLSRQASRDSATTNARPPSLIQRTRKVSGDIANRITDAFTGHRMNTHAISRPERAAESRRHTNHSNARAALGGLGLRRAQSTSQLDGQARVTPSQPIAMEWDYGKDNVWATANQVPEKPRSGRLKFTLFKSSSQKDLRSLSAHPPREASKIVWLPPNRDPDQPQSGYLEQRFQKDGKPYELPMPRSSSTRNPDLGPDRPTSLVPSVCNALGLGPSEQGRGRREETVTEYMDRLQSAKNTSYQGRVREVPVEQHGAARAHKERLARLEREKVPRSHPSVSRVPMEVKSKPVVDRPPATIAVKASAASSIPKDSPRPQQVQFPHPNETEAKAMPTVSTPLPAAAVRTSTVSSVPKDSPRPQPVKSPRSNESIAKPQCSPPLKFPASYAPNARSLNARRVTTLDFPAPGQSVPSSPSLVSIDLSSIRGKALDDSDDSTDEADDIFDNALLLSGKPVLRRYASMSDLTTIDDSESMDTVVRRQDATGRFGHLYHRVLKEARRATEAAAAAGMGPRRGVFAGEMGIALPLIKPLALGKRAEIHHVELATSETAVVECWESEGLEKPTKVRTSGTPVTIPASALAAAKVSSINGSSVNGSATTGSSISSSEAAKATDAKMSHAPNPSIAPSTPPSLVKPAPPSSQATSAAANPQPEPLEDALRKPADLRRTPSSSTRDKPGKVVGKGSVRDLVSHFQAQAQIAVASPVPSVPKLQAVVRPSPPQAARPPTPCTAATPSVRPVPRKDQPTSRPAVPVPTETAPRPSQLEDSRQKPSEKPPTGPSHSRRTSRQYAPSPAPTELHARAPAVSVPVSSHNAASKVVRTSTPAAAASRASMDGRRTPASPQPSMPQQEKRARRHGVVAQAEPSRHRQHSEMRTSTPPISPNPPARGSHTKRRSSRRESAVSEVTYFTLDLNAPWGVTMLPGGQ